MRWRRLYPDARHQKIAECGGCGGNHTLPAERRIGIIESIIQSLITPCLYGPCACGLLRSPLLLQAREYQERVPRTILSARTNMIRCAALTERRIRTNAKRIVQRYQSIIAESVSTMTTMILATTMRM